MPGSSLLSRKKKHVQRAAVSKKLKSLVSPSPPYEPSPDAPIRQLQPYLKYAWRVWWNDWIGEPFLSRKKNRGNKNGAKPWVREQFCGPWWEENLPDVKASKRDKLWYFDHTKVGEQIYAYLHNSSVRGSKGRDPNGPGSNRVVTKRGSAGHDLWRRENPDLYEEEVEKWKTQHKKEPNFGELRKISGMAFKRRSEEEQVKWNRIAKDALKASQAPVEATESADHTHAEYYEKYSQAFDTLMTEGGKRANIRVCALVLHEKHDGGLKVDCKISEEYKEFTKSPSFATAIRALHEWIEEISGTTVEAAIPEPMVQSSLKKRTRNSKGKEKQRTSSIPDEDSLAGPGPESEKGEPNYDEFDKTSQGNQDEDDCLSPAESSDSLLTMTGLLAGARSNDSDIDQLRLRPRYGYNWVNTLFESHSSDVPCTTSTNSWVYSDAVFGQFRDLPAYKPIAFDSSHCLEQFHAITKSCKEAMDELYEYLESNPQIPSKLAREAHAQAQDYPRCQILYEYILLCRAVWDNASQVAVSGIFGHGTYIALLVREATEAQKWVRTMERGVRVNTFDDAIRSANKAAVELQWTFNELCALQRLATKWYNNLRGNWLYGEIPADLSTLVGIVQGLLNWADETTDLVTQLRSDRKVVWETHVDGPFEPKQAESEILYWFGCPSVVEEPVGLRDEFKKAQTILSNCKAVKGSLKSSEILSDDQDTTSAPPISHRTVVKRKRDAEPAGTSSKRTSARIARINDRLELPISMANIKAIGEGSSRSKKKPIRWT
ncbi:unnamed protein product [Rhizoctonia solani]|uniref:Uncharacterized protein n=1 Tax=Rhizoctonia solani TaxID=456999 RepID=A0A8H3DH40_9AGAM|nr:unnamed protein product [Rhizoctonia solani]